MYKVIALLFLVALVNAEQHPINREIVADIRRLATTWEPMEPHMNPLFFRSTEQIKGMLGTILPKEFPKAEEVPVQAVPTTFDSRTQWPGCVGAIRNQEQCGSCWAFAAAESLSDRFCIASKGATKVKLSPEDLVQCDSDNMGCNGGYLSYAWQYLQTTGICTDSCQPYTSGTGITGTCMGQKCSDSETFKAYKCQSGSAFYASTPNSIKAAIQAGGPMETGFTVYQDFMSYKSGVYKHTTGSMLGGHAVKIIGWGTESGEDYWLVANSWGTSWGLQGFFKIALGQCGIDSQVFGCTPAV